MISRSCQSSLQEFIFVAFAVCRHQTLVLFEGMDTDTFCSQLHPDFSPVGWHLGHIAFTESLWLLEKSAGLPCLFPQYRKLFAADGLPKSERIQLPDLAETLYYLNIVREKVLEYMQIANIKQQEALWRFLLQHESQHSEIVIMVLELLKTQKRDKIPPPDLTPSTFSEMVLISAGQFEQGSNSIEGLDNEYPAHQVYLEDFWIDRYPVTCGQYQAFIKAGGYQNPHWWSEAGWQWLKIEQVTQPLYWCDDLAQANHPVYGVSWYEAEAYSRFVGKRLPTEAEWEKAACWNGRETTLLQNCNRDCLIGKTTPVNAYPGGQSAYGLYNTLGNVWEWTASWFDGYQGFQSYPYPGYSQVYFDHQHRVLKGGSWATRIWVLRPSFRNWYQPQMRQIFAGFRCASTKLIK